MRFFALLSPLALSVALALTGCDGGGQGGATSGGSAAAGGGTIAPPPPGPEGVVRVNITTDPKTLDPGLANDIPSGEPLRHLFEGLTRLDREGNPMPAAAESWEPNEDYTKWTFHLRPAATWSNGDPVTAQDFVYSIKRVMDPKTASDYGFLVYSFVKGGEAVIEGRTDEELGVRAVDENTLEIELNFPAPFFPTLVALPIWFPVHPPTLEKHGNAWINSPDTYVSNGPFLLQEYRPKDRIVLKKNPDFWDAENVGLDRLEYYMIEQATTELASFLTGGLDITANVALTEVPRMRQTPYWNTSPFLGTYYVGLNVTKAPLDDPKVRRALLLSIPRNQIVNEVTRRGERPAEGFVPRGINLSDGADYRDAAGSLIPQDYAANVEEAKRLLKEAGYGPGGKTLKFEYLYNEAEDHHLIAQILQQFWKQIGAEVTLQKVEWGVLLDRGKRGDFQAKRTSWIADYNDPMSFLDIFISGSGNNTTGWKNPEYDALLQKAKFETNAETRAELMAQAEKMLMDQAIAMPIFQYAVPFLVHPEVKGYWRSQFGNTDLSRATRTRANAEQKAASTE